VEQLMEDTNTNTKSARTWLFIFGAGFLVCYALLVASLLTPIPYGDLTRIGRISEVEFGWQKAPPPIPDADVKASSIQDADVLVIGDSFSVRYAWQSQLVGAGYRVATTHWDNTGPVCSDFSSWLAKSGFKGKVVVLESIERLLEDRIEKAEACKTMEHDFKPVPPPFENPSRPKPGFQLDWDAQLLSGWLTFKNTREIMRSNSWTNTPDAWGPLIDARVVPEGCKQFSHKACDKLLMTAEDRVNAKLSVKSARFMASFAAQSAPYRVLWMVIPNKSTVYLDQHHADEFRAAFNPLGVGPDLFELAAQNRFKVTDLFPANETHVSTAGYLVLGRRMLEAVREVLPAPAAKSP
jgi:hypothetical protein